jgi:retron-type reverse transcriptase
MRDQMIRFRDGNRLLSPYQSGFRSNHSTAMALLKITNDMHRDCDRSLATLLLLLDFSKAFDNVQHSLLLRKLSLYFKLGGRVLRWLSLVLIFQIDISVCLWVEFFSELITVTRTWCRVLC